MSGYDEGQVVTSAASIDTVEAQQDRANEARRMQIATVQRQFREFVRNYSADGEYVYRDQLLARFRLHEPYLAVALDHIQAWDAQLADLLLTAPQTYVPVLEAGIRDACESLVHAEELAAAGPTLEFQAHLSWSARPMFIRQLQSEHIAKLVTVRGIVIAASRTRAKVTTQHIVCRNCKAGKTIPVTGGLGGNPLPRKCDASPECPLDPFVVVSDKCSFVDQQMLKLQEAPETVPTGEMPRHILCAVDRALEGRAAPGTRVSIVGIYSIYQTSQPGQRASAGSDVSLRTPYLRVVGLSLDNSGNNQSRGAAYLASEEPLYKELATDARCMERIVQSIDPAIFGHENIKKAIACLLMGGARKAPLPTGQRIRGDINVLLLGDPSTAKSQMLKFVEKVAPIGVYTSGKGSSAAGLTASVVRDGTSGEFYLEGGSMVLADGGVVCIDEFDKMRPNDRVAIHEAMEQQTISIAKAGITTILNSRTSVLAAANPTAGRYDDLKAASEQIDFATTILSRFDLIFIVRDVRDEARDQALAQHVLNVHRTPQAATNTNLISNSNNNNNGNTVNGGVASVNTGASGNNSGSAGLTSLREGELPVDFLRRYVAYVRAHCSPRLNAEGAKALENFFVKIRSQMRTRQRESRANVRQIPITVRQLESLVRIAESLAKMTLSREANASHVEQAIELFKVATMEAANSGMLQIDEYMAPEVRAEILKCEVALQRQMHIDQAAPVKMMIDALRRQGFSESSAQRAMLGLEKRGDFEFRNQKKTIVRKR